MRARMFVFASPAAGVCSYIGIWGSGLNLFPLQILKETLHLRLELVWSIFLYKLAKKSFIWGLSWFETSCFTNPLKIFIWGWIWFESSCFTDPLDPWENDSFVTGAGLDHFPSQILQERLHLKLKLVWSTLLHRSFKKGFIEGWSWFEASCLTDPLRKASFEAGPGLKHLA